MSVPAVSTIGHHEGPGMDTELKQTHQRTHIEKLTFEPIACDFVGRRASRIRLNDGLQKAHSMVQLRPLYSMIDTELGSMPRQRCKIRQSLTRERLPIKISQLALRVRGSKAWKGKWHPGTAVRRHLLLIC